MPFICIAIVVFLKCIYNISLKVGVLLLINFIFGLGVIPSSAQELFLFGSRESFLAGLKQHKGYWGSNPGGMCKTNALFDVLPSEVELLKGWHWIFFCLTSLSEKSNQSSFCNEIRKLELLPNTIWQFLNLSFSIEQQNWKDGRDVE